MAIKGVSSRDDIKLSNYVIGQLEAASAELGRVLNGRNSPSGVLKTRAYLDKEGLRGDIEKLISDVERAMRKAAK